MDWNAEVRAALARRHPQVPPDEDVVEELAQHAETSFHAARGEGLDEEAAAARVGALIAGWSAAMPATPRAAGRPAAAPPPAASRGLGGLALDLRYALRQLRRHPGFALAAGATTALGIAAATTIVGLIWGVLLQPLPWPDAERLVQLSETRQGSTRLLPPLLTNATYLTWQDRHRTLDTLAAYSSHIVTLALPGAEPQRVRVVEATASLFPLVSARAQLGSLFTAEEERSARTVAVLSADSWRRRFGGDPGVAGRTITLDGTAYTVIGVAPNGFSFPRRDVEAWVPLRVPPVNTPGGGQAVALFSGVGRLAAGATAVQATAEGTTRARAATPLGMAGLAIFGSEGPAAVTAQPLLDALTGEVRPALLLLLAAVLLLVATAVGNIAGMQLARAVARRREIAIRAAVGAGAGRIARQLLVENVVLGLLSGVAGVGLAAALVRLLPRLLPRGFPRLAEVTLDARVAALGMLLALVAGLACGLFPVALAYRTRLAAALLGEGMWGRRRLSASHARSLVMGVQVAIAVLLLIAAGLLARSFAARLHADRGFEPRHLLTATLPMPGPEFDGTRRRAVVDTLLARLRTLPEVEEAAVTSVLPLGTNESVAGFTMQSAGGGTVQVQAALREVTPAYFRALGLRLVAGRLLAATDVAGAPRAVVVSRSFANTFLAGRPLRAMLPIDESWQVVGVVDDVRASAVTDAPRPEIYVPIAQLTDGLEHDQPQLVVRTAGDPAALVPTLRALVRQQAPTVAIESILTMEERLAGSLAQPRLYALLLAAFAAFALLVTAVGLFAVLSYTVAQRTRDLGVRSALGATPALLGREVLRQCLLVTGCGLVAGVVPALALARWLDSLVLGISVRDPLTFVGAPLLLLLVALLSGLLPALRAARLDVVRALGA
ncbi:MAG TPA: ADOP family duplicated permease [Thermoanaerobaculia bacterium]|jgi:predicted permease|nr:ADOP family duplicated permease [Thermoanaerobaculia bacterium]